MAKTLLVPIDLNHDKTFKRVFQAVREQVAGHDEKTTVHLLTVVPNFSAGMFPHVPHKLMDETRAEADSKLYEVGKQWLGDDVPWHSEAQVGAVARSIVEAAQQQQADLIVMASHDPTAIDILLGSVADQVIRRAHCSVLVVRQPSGA